jgi:serine/threonine protein kinase
MAATGPRHVGHTGQAMDVPGPLRDERRGGRLPAPGGSGAGRRAGEPADSAAATEAARADARLIGGRYRLAAAIGQGSMGRVWGARDLLLGRDVAIKEVRLPPGLSEAEQDKLRQRMLREARSAARLSHPAVAAVHDVIGDLGRPWIVMELVNGHSLDRVIAKDGPLSPKAAAQIGRQLLDALAAAHAAGVLHRDVKPSNVLLTRDGRAVLTDFGVAVIDGDASLTQASGRRRSRLRRVRGRQAARIASHQDHRVRPVCTQAALACRSGDNPHRGHRRSQTKDVIWIGGHNYRTAVHGRHSDGVRIDDVLCIRSGTMKDGPDAAS